MQFTETTTYRAVFRNVNDEQSSLHKRQRRTVQFIETPTTNSAVYRNANDEQCSLQKANDEQCSLQKRQRRTVQFTDTPTSNSTVYRNANDEQCSTPPSPPPLLLLPAKTSLCDSLAGPIGQDVCPKSGRGGDRSLALPVAVMPVT